MSSSNVRRISAFCAGLVPATSSSFELPNLGSKRSPASGDRHRFNDDVSRHGGAAGTEFLFNRNRFNVAISRAGLEQVDLGYAKPQLSGWHSCAYALKEVRAILLE